MLADPTLLAVPASAPWKTLQDFVDDAKKRPGQIPYGSSGPYGTLHVAMEMFAASAGIKLLHVPFRGAGPALTALLSGTVQALASAPGTLKQQVDDGKMRVLANWGAERIASFPDLPTFKELGYKDVEFYIWAGLFAQSALPAPIMTRLREAMAQVVKAPEVIKTFETAGSPVAYHGRAGIFEIRRRGQRAPDRGGEEDRQGGVGRRTSGRHWHSHFRCCRANLAQAVIQLSGANLLAACIGARRNQRASTPNREGSDMRMHHIALSLALTLGCRRSPLQSAASAEEYAEPWNSRWPARRMFGGSAATRFRTSTGSWHACGKTRRSFPSGCRAVFESNASMHQQQPAARGRPPRRSAAAVDRSQYAAAANGLRRRRVDG